MRVLWHQTRLRGVTLSRRPASAMEDCRGARILRPTPSCCAFPWSPPLPPPPIGCHVPSLILISSYPQNASWTDGGGRVDLSTPVVAASLGASGPFPAIVSDSIGYLWVPRALARAFRALAQKWSTVAPPRKTSTCHSLLSQSNESVQRVQVGLQGATVWSHMVPCFVVDLVVSVPWPLSNSSSSPPSPFGSPSPSLPKADSKI